MNDLTFYHVLQGPEHCHIDFCKQLSGCIKNKDVFLCFMRWYVCAGHLQYLCSLDTDATATNGDFGHEDDAQGIETKMREVASWESNSPTCRLLGSNNQTTMVSNSTAL
jgi:hypothetical protein